MAAEDSLNYRYPTLPSGGGLVGATGAPGLRFHHASERARREELAGARFDELLALYPPQLEVAAALLEESSVGLLALRSAMRPTTVQIAKYAEDKRPRNIRDLLYVDTTRMASVLPNRHSLFWGLTRSERVQLAGVVHEGILLHDSLTRVLAMSYRERESYYEREIYPWSVEVVLGKETWPEGKTTTETYQPLGLITPWSGEVDSRFERELAGAREDYIEKNADHVDEMPPVTKGSLEKELAQETALAKKNGKLSHLLPDVNGPLGYGRHAYRDRLENYEYLTRGREITEGNYITEGNIGALRAVGQVLWWLCKRAEMQPAEVFRHVPDVYEHIILPVAAHDHGIT